MPCIALIARLLRLPRRHRKTPPAGHKQVPTENLDRPDWFLALADMTGKLTMLVRWFSHYWTVLFEWGRCRGLEKCLEKGWDKKTKRFEMKPNEKHHPRKSQSYPAAGSFYNPLSLGMDKVCRLCLARTWSGCFGPWSSSWPINWTWARWAVWIFTKVRQKLMGPDHGSLLRIAGDVSCVGFCSSFLVCCSWLSEV